MESRFGMYGEFNANFLNGFQNYLCRVVVEKKNKENNNIKNLNKCLFCRIKKISDEKVLLKDTKGINHSVSIKSIKSIWVNEEQW